MKKTVINWGIIGLGKIARKFAEDLQRLPDARLHAVASTSPERAQAFAAEFGAQHAFGAYQDITDCPGLDALYVATPHPQPADCAQIALDGVIPVVV